MGTFESHLLHGSIFITLAISWLIQIARLYNVTSKLSLKFPSQATYYCCCRKCSTINFEAIFKIIFSTIGIILEILAAYDWGASKTLHWYGNLTYANIYLFLWISGIIDLLVSRGCVTIKKIDHAFLTLAFVAEAILFFQDYLSKTGVEKQLHFVLIVSIFFIILSLILEILLLPNVLYSLFKVFSVLLHGVWFIVTGFILTNPPSNEQSWLNIHGSTVIPLLFTSTMIFIVVIMATIFTCATKLTVSSVAQEEQSRELTKRINLNKLNGDSEIRQMINSEDSGSDDELFYGKN